MVQPGLRLDIPAIIAATATAVAASAAQGYAASPQPLAAASGGGARTLRKPFCFQLPLKRM